VVPALVTFLWLCFGHCIADYGLQSNFMAIAKSRHTDLGKQYWKTVLSAHSATHAGSVGLVLHTLCGLSWSAVTLFGVAEFIVHFAIDFGKCEEWFSFHTDQGLHILCKLLWVIILFTMFSPVVV
jgi:hypothetical protein